MFRYIIKRLLLMIPVLLGVSILLFFLQGITPGDPADLVLGDGATVEEKATWKAQYDLDKPIFVQYGKFMLKLITKGDFGTSYRTGKSINEEISSRWPITFNLAVLSTLVSTVVGVSLGIIAANHRGKLLDLLSRALAIVGISMPNFWFALLLILLFAMKIRIVPVSGLYEPSSWILPVMTLGILGAASLMRITRSSMLDNIQQDFVRTARAKGQSESVITRHHVLRNALIPIITSIGAHFSSGMAGTMVIEQIFSIPGLGRLMIDAVNNRDYPELRACVMLIAFTVSVVYLIVDLVYAAIDPRVKANLKNTKPLFKTRAKRGEKSAAK